MAEPQMRIALLIDCDNASHKAIGGILAELSKHGETNIRRAYGNWQSQLMAGWQKALLPHAIQPIQQFAYTKGKNATDAAMIIDAMDLLYTRNLDAFALVTSDSDFTPLAMRLRANGLRVLGFGREETPESFQEACSEFLITENLERSDSDKENGTPKPAVRKSRQEMKQDSRLVKTLREAVEEKGNDDGWANLSGVVEFIRNNSSLHPKNYGFSKWLPLLREIELFEINEAEGSVVRIRDRRRSKLP